MAAEKDTDVNKRDRRGTVCKVVISQDTETGTGGDCGPPIIFNPDFFVEKLRHERPEAFTELVLSNITRLIDLPGAEFSQLQGDEEPKTPTSTAAGGFFRSFNFLKRKDKGVVFGMPLTEEGIAQIYQLIMYLIKNLHVEGLFRVPGNSLRQQILREQLNSGADINFASELTMFDDQGNKTSLPDKERQIEALQLLLMLLPTANRTLLKLLLDLLYHTAKQQDKNKMSAHNLALMFAPHVIWPKNMNASDLQENLKKLNSGMAFLIKHSQKIFRAPAYLREHARLQFANSKIIHSKDDLELLSVSGSPFTQACKRSGAKVPLDSENHTEEALRELYQHVTDNVPNSAKKKKLIRQLGKQSTPGTPVNENTTPTSKKHARSRSFGGLIKRKVLGGQPGDRRGRHVSPTSTAGRSAVPGKENVNCETVS
ncbi:rho GTPase-activating protein 19 isoform X2 [Triplophysa rosa]|uniref:rho GTPase-activating protein 19 isoform X2 n=1 Tax=Triplophysa rosa TaxID=992332 RepID=UPI002545FF0D|nr:rho GTPase-activating protein 19 isoform X2 [Triplophysa rosa]